MDLKQKYREETNLEPYADTSEKYPSYSDKYVKWLEKQLASCSVSGKLLEITLEDWEHTCGDGCCYSYGEDIYLNGEKLDEQNAEDSKNALTAVLTKLGYNVEINYR